LRLSSLVAQTFLPLFIVAAVTNRKCMNVYIYILYNAYRRVIQLKYEHDCITVRIVRTTHFLPRRPFTRYSILFLYILTLAQSPNDNNTYRSPNMLIIVYYDLFRKTDFREKKRRTAAAASYRTSVQSKLSLNWRIIV